MPAEKTEQVMVRMEPEMLRQLRERAEAEERSVAQTVRLAIRAYLGGCVAGETPPIAYRGSTNVMTGPTSAPIRARNR